MGKKRPGMMKATVSINTEQVQEIIASVHALHKGEKP